MPLPRSIPAGQTQFTAQRYRALLEQRGHRVPAILKKLANQASEEAQTLLAQIKQLEQARLTTQADYLTIRTAARIRVLEVQVKLKPLTAKSRPIDNALSAFNRKRSIKRFKIRQ